MKDGKRATLIKSCHFSEEDNGILQYVASAEGEIKL
jgi:hypothetical protein